MTNNEKKIETLRLSNEESNKLSREALKHAFIELLSKKTIHEISITELVKKAGVSRATFYRNYNTKEDVIDDFINDMTNYIEENFEPANYDTAYNLYLNLFIKLKENARTMQILFKANISFSSFVKLSPLSTIAKTSKDLAGYYQNLAVEGAFFYVVKNWILNDMKKTPEEMANICVKVMPQVKLAI